MKNHNGAICTPKSPARSLKRQENGLVARKTCEVTANGGTSAIIVVGQIVKHVTKFGICSDSIFV